MTDETKPRRKSLGDLLKDVCLPTNQQRVDDLLEQYRAKFPMPEDIALVPRPYNGLPPALTDQHFVDAVRHMQDAEAKKMAAAYVASRREKTLSDFSSADLVMEMLARGFAVMKLPEDGGAPEVLRNG